MISAMIPINFIIIYLNFCVFEGENLIQIHNLVNFIIENNKKYTANVLTIKIMDFDHVPNPGIMSP